MPGDQDGFILVLLWVAQLEVEICPLSSVDNINNLNTHRNDPDVVMFCTDGTSSFQKAAVCGGRMVPAELLDSGDMECSLCMR